MMPERIPLLEERMSFLQNRLNEMHLENKAEIQELKSEHISDIRKNVCRLWMAFDEMRLSVNKICISLERIRGSEEAKSNIKTAIFGLAAASISGLVVYILFHGSIR